MRTLHRIARHLRSTDGAEIAEVALVLPLVFMFLLGIVWFGRAFNIYSTIQQAAQQGAITATRPSCATCSSGNFPPDAVVQTAVEGIMKSSSLDTTKILVNPNPSGPLFCANIPNGCSITSDNIKVCRNVLLNPSAGVIQTAQCGTVVSLQYPFQFYLPFTSLNSQQILLSAQAQARMEN